MGRKYGFSFSWMRASGLSSAKGRLSRQTGIPLSRSGRQRKVGRAAGCLILIGLIAGGIIAIGVMIVLVRAVI